MFFFTLSFFFRFFFFLGSAVAVAVAPSTAALLDRVSSVLSSGGNVPAPAPVMTNDDVSKSAGGSKESSKKSKSDLFDAALASLTTDSVKVTTTANQTTPVIYVNKLLR